MAKSAGSQNVKRQHMGGLQHNKFIVVDGPKGQFAVCGSTNFSWRGFYVSPTMPSCCRAKAPSSRSLRRSTTTGKTTMWPVRADGLSTLVGPRVERDQCESRVSPHSAANALLQSVADDMQTQPLLPVLFAGLSLRDPRAHQGRNHQGDEEQRLSLWLSDKEVGGTPAKPDGNLAPVFAAALSKNLPEPFKSEPTGGGGTRMHHKLW